MGEVRGCQHLAFETNINFFLPPSHVCKSDVWQAFLSGAAHSVWRPPGNLYILVPTRPAVLAARVRRVVNRNNAMLWDDYQPMRIGAAERAAESAEAKVERYTKELDNLQRHVDRLSLACQALWELIQSCSDLTEQDLEKKILEIDGRDGCVDGKIGSQVLDCPSCGRKTSSKRNSCIMCGAPLKRPYAFGG